MSVLRPRIISDEAVFTMDLAGEDECMQREDIDLKINFPGVIDPQSASEDRALSRRSSKSPRQRAQAITAREIRNIKTKEERHGVWRNLQNQTALARLRKEQNGISEEIAMKQEALELIRKQITQYADTDTEEEKSLESDRTYHKHMLWMISGLVNGVLRILFCYAFATIIHESAGDLLKDSVGIGVGVQLVSAFITCTTTALWSTVGASIGGPDIIQALLLASMGNIISEQTDDKDVALATILFLTSLTTLLIAINWLLISRFYLIAVVDYFPISFVTGFLGCIGYKALTEAVHISVNRQFRNAGNPTFWNLLLPAIPVGLSLFFFKKYRIGFPVLIYSFCLSTPVIIFFVALYASSEDLRSARTAG